MSEAVKGTRLIYKYRVYVPSGAAPAASAIAFTTENTRTKSKDADSTATKDGSIRTPGASEQEIESVSIFQKGDTFIDALETAMDNDSLIEIWEIDLDAPASGTSSQNKYDARYFQGYITEMEKTSNAEEYVEISLTFGINGNGVTGQATVTDAEIEAASYVFADTTQRTS